MKTLSQGQTISYSLRTLIRLSIVWVLHKESFFFIETKSFIDFINKKKNRRNYTCLPILEGIIKEFRGVEVTLFVDLAAELWKCGSKSILHKSNFFHIDVIR